jgi:hypothetical protein
MRNIPDVSLVADDIWVIYDDGASNSFIGTRAAAPLWAGFIALANQQAAAGGKPPVGFINPAIYAIGQGGNYSACFHDIITGNNTNAQSHNLYQAVSGYDLCTGWGTPIGAVLINALAPPDTLQILPVTGLTAYGGAAPLTWALALGVPWLAASPAGGTLTPGGPAVTVTISLNSAASNEAVGVYNGSVWFTNLTDAVVQNRAFVLNVVAPPAFTTAPESQTIFTGATASFTAAASSAVPVSYQWQQNGTNLGGATTTSLTLASVTLADAGSYTVTASNVAGVTTSAPPALLNGGALAATAAKRWV